MAEVGSRFATERNRSKTSASRASPLAGCLSCFGGDIADSVVLHVNWIHMGCPLDSERWPSCSRSEAGWFQGLWYEAVHQLLRGAARCTLHELCGRRETSRKPAGKSDEDGRPCRPMCQCTLTGGFFVHTSPAKLCSLLLWCLATIDSCFIQTVIFP